MSRFSRDVYTTRPTSINRHSTWPYHVTTAPDHTTWPQHVTVPCDHSTWSHHVTTAIRDHVVQSEMKCIHLTFLARTAPSYHSNNRQRLPQEHHVCPRWRVHDSRKSTWCVQYSYCIPPPVYCSFQHMTLIFDLLNPNFDNSCLSHNASSM